MQMDLAKSPGRIRILFAAGADFQVGEGHTLFGQNFDYIYGCASGYGDKQQVGRFDPNPFIRGGKDDRMPGRVNPNKLLSFYPFDGCGSHFTLSLWSLI
jgi:hypothetical protein